MNAGGEQQTQRFGTARPVWFGKPDRPLLGWYHAPADGTARAGVVICPPLGREYLRCHYALRLLAEGLASRGLCAFRFDYDGTGDSAGEGRDPCRVAAWTESATAAIELVRQSGVPTVGVVGMRLGATLAAVAALRLGDLDALVLWDPVVSGRAYLTEQRALSALSSGATPTRSDGSVETPGVAFDAATASDLRSLVLPCPPAPLARKVLVLRRTTPVPGQLVDGLHLPGAQVDVVPGQAELLDVASPWQILPHQTIERVANWLSEVPAGPPSDVRVPDPAGAAVVSAGAKGLLVTETPMFVGPVGLFGIMTESPACTAGPTALFISVANQHRVGPNRLWVDLARRWAGAGVRSFRLDLSGVGDSPLRRAEQPSFVAWAPEAFDDVADTARALCPHDPSDVVLIGHSASGYQVCESALELAPRGMISVDPVICFRPPEIDTSGVVEPRRRVALTSPAVVQSFQAGRKGATPLTLRSKVALWGCLLRAPKRRASSWMGQLVRLGVDVLLVCGPEGALPIRLGASERRLRALGRSGRFRFELLKDLDHGLMGSAQRARAAEIITEHVLERFGQHQERQASSHLTGDDGSAALVRRPARRA
jgi:alpha-beta hydrolase superfamily lysophospholipase